MAITRTPASRATSGLTSGVGIANEKTIGVGPYTFARMGERSVAGLMSIREEWGEMPSEEKHGLPPSGRGLSHRARAFLKLAEACLERR